MTTECSNSNFTKIIHVLRANRHLRLKFKFRTHTKDTVTIEMIATVTTLLPIVSNKKVNASGNNQRL